MLKIPKSSHEGPEISYIKLACMKFKIDPSSLLKFHEYDEGLYVITAEGKKIHFTFEDLEDYAQYLKDNRPKREKIIKEESSQPAEDQKNAVGSTKIPSKSAKDTKNT